MVQIRNSGYLILNLFSQMYFLFIVTNCRGGAPPSVDWTRVSKLLTCRHVYSNFSLGQKHKVSLHKSFWWKVIIISLFPLLHLTMQRFTANPRHGILDCYYFVFVSLFMWALVCSSEAMCPEACDCLSNHVRICTNVTSLEDILENSRLVEELTLVRLQVLSSIKDHFGSSFASLRRLKIQQSFISTVTDSFVAVFPNVETVILEDNKFECSEKILPLRNWRSKIEISSDNLNCSSPDGFTGAPIFLALKSIKEAIKDCPRPCRCAAKSLQIYNSIPNLLINCSHSNLKAIPTSLPTHPWVIELDLSHNRVTWTIVFFPISPNYCFSFIHVDWRYISFGKHSSI